MSSQTSPDHDNFVHESQRVEEGILDNPLGLEQDSERMGTGEINDGKSSIEVEQKQDSHNGHEQCDAQDDDDEETHVNEATNSSGSGNTSYPWITKDVIKYCNSDNFDSSDESDCENSYGGKKSTKTHLMIACQKADKDAVRKLLLRSEDGVNDLCSKTGNTALHFSCIDRNMTGDLDQRGIEVKERISARIEIAGMLLTHGAVYIANAQGMTPVYLAGKYMMVELVEYLCQCSEVLKVAPKDELIRGLEFVGVSAAIYEPRNPYTAWKFFSITKEMRGDELIPASSYSCPELLECYGRKEIDSAIALENIQTNASAMELEGYLVASRVFPKDVYPWRHLLLCAIKKAPDHYPVCQKLLPLAVKRILNQENVNVLFQILMCAAQSNLPLLCSISFSIILETFLQFLEQADRAWVCSLARDMGRIISKILYVLAQSNCHFREPLLSIIESLFFHLQEANRGHCQIDQNTSSLGCAWSVITRIAVKDMPDMRFSSALTFGNIQLLISCLLREEGAHYTKRGRTMLHQLSKRFWDIVDMSYWESGLAYKEFILWLTDKVIMFGCPLDAKNHEGMTAYDEALYSYRSFISVMGMPNWRAVPDDEDYMHEIRLMRLLSGSTAMHSLEEVCARCILKEKIPYKGVLPPPLWYFIETAYRC